MPILSNPKHEKFAQAVARGETYADATRFAGYVYDPSNTSKLSKNTKICTRVDELRVKTSKRIERRSEVTVDRLVAELENIAVADITAILEWGETISVSGKKGDRLVYGVKVRSLDSIPTHVRSAISEVRQTRDGVVVKLHDKLKAIDMLGRYRRMWADSKADEAAMSLEALLTRGYELAAERDRKMIDVTPRKDTP